MTCRRLHTNPTENHFRIVEIHPNGDPKLFEAVISNGSETGPVRFRLQSPRDQNSQIGITSPRAPQTKKPEIPAIIPPSAQKKN